MSLDRILQATVKAGGQEVRLVPGRRIVILTPAGEREVQGPEQTPSTIDQLLAPILKIADVRTDKRIDFVGGARGTGELERVVDQGKAAVAFSLYPVSVSELMAVSDDGAIMPPKSTWFEPKLRDGLLIHLI